MSEYEYRSVMVPASTGGADGTPLRFVVPTDRHWRLQCAHVLMTTDGLGAEIMVMGVNREGAGGDTLNYMEFRSQTAISTETTMRYHFMPALAAVQDTGQEIVLIPRHIELPPASAISFTLSGGAGINGSEAFDARLIVEQRGGK